MIQKHSQTVDDADCRYYTQNPKNIGFKTETKLESLGRIPKINR